MVQFPPGAQLNSKHNVVLQHIIWDSLHSKIFLKADLYEMIKNSKVFVSF